MRQGRKSLIKKEKNMKTTIKKVSAKVWEWTITLHGEIVAGGYCRTMAHCVNDSNFWMSIKS